MIWFHGRFACYSPLSPTPSTSAQASRRPTRGPHVVTTQGPWLANQVLRNLVCTRLPSDSRASTQSDDSSTRRPSGATILSITWRKG
jgi:hypothetical protein